VLRLESLILLVQLHLRKALQVLDAIWSRHCRPALGPECRAVYAS